MYNFVDFPDFSESVCKYYIIDLRDVNKKAGFRVPILPFSPCIFLPDMIKYNMEGYPPRKDGPPDRAVLKKSMQAIP